MSCRPSKTTLSTCFILIPYRRCQYVPRTCSRPALIEFQEPHRLLSSCFSLNDRRLSLLCADLILFQSLRSAGDDGLWEVLEWDSLGSIGHSLPHKNFSRVLTAFDLPQPAGAKKRKAASEDDDAAVISVPFRSSVLALLGSRSGEASKMSFSFALVLFFVALVLNQRSPDFLGFALWHHPRYEEAAGG